MDDDADNIEPEDRVLLIVENDASFAQLLMEMAHENGFKALISARGSDALPIARERKIDAVTLDINLHDLDGWRILARLKDDLKTRHIPVYIITTEEAQARGLRSGALGILTKPLKSKDDLREVFARIDQIAKTHTKHLLITSKDENRRQHLISVLEEPNLQISEASTGEETLTKIRDNPFAAVVIDSELADMTGLDLIEEIKKDTHLSDIPIIAYVPGNISKKDELHLKRLGQAMNLKEVHSEERLLDECALFLHQDISKIKESKHKIIQRLYQAETVLKGKKILIVDDDIRNIFAMTSLLERYEMQIFSAETGKIALEQLHSQPDIDAVLMDIMMPDMDGYDTMRAIRKFSKFRTLPMIAVTAKAMKGDRDKCIEAGASDYIAKPVDSAELLSMLRLWLHR
jgi:CheY-like chemotaxis protein